MGFGAAAGVLAAGVLATQYELPPSRVLLIDLGASLGALTGAAAASPLLIVDDQPSKGRDRAWLGSVALGTLIGGAAGWYFTRSTKTADSAPPARPSVGVVGMSSTPDGRLAPVFGAGVSGSW
jgi:hypothetical protein